MKLIIFTLFLLLNALAVNAQHKLIYSDTRFQYVLTVDSVLTTDSVNYDCVVKSIKILTIKNHKLIQVIIPEENHPFCNLPQNQLFIMEDMNFDGINDIRLVQFLPAAANVPYYCWIYDTAANRFIRNKALEKITSPDFDPKKKLIFSFWQASCCDHGLSTYKYINGHPTLIEQSEFAEDEVDTSKYILTVKKLINGKWKRTKTIEKRESSSNQ